MSERKKKIESALNKLFSASKSKVTAPPGSSNEAAGEALLPQTEVEIVRPVRRTKPATPKTPLASTPEPVSSQSPISDLPTVGEGEIQAEETAAARIEAKPAQPLSGMSPIAAADHYLATSQSASETRLQPSAPSMPAESATKKTAGDGRSKGEEGDFFVTREAASEEICQLVIFTLAGESFGLPIDRVESIIKPQAITVVPHARPYVVGVTNLRGTVLPVIDLRRRFRITAAEQTEDQRIVVVLFNDEKIGLMVDSVTQVLRLPQAAIEPPPPIVTAFVHSAFVTGIAKVDERLVILLDLEKVLLPEHGN
jgi:purine-binding chemotaxis protein CheW